MREKAVREADSDPIAAGLINGALSAAEEEERVVRSFRIAVLCFRAELKEVFWGSFVRSADVWNKELRHAAHTMIGELLVLCEYCRDC